MSKINPKEDINKQLIKACGGGHLEVVKYLLTSPELKEHANIHAGNDCGFCDACVNGHLEVVKYLLTSPDLEEHTNIHAGNDFGFRWACSHGYIEIVKYLLTSPDLKEHADIHSMNDCGFKWACENGHLEVVKYLVNEIDAYTVEKIKILKISDSSEISKKEVIELLKEKHLKNELSDEVLLKNKTPKRKALGI